MKKIISFLLVTMLALSLIGCGSKEPEILGTYETEVDLIDSISEEVNASLTASGIEISFADYMDSFSIVLISEFKEDGTYAQYVDESSVKSALNTYKEALIPMMDDVTLKTFADQFLAYGVTIETKEDVEEVTNMSWDELFSTALGMSQDEFVNQVMETANIDGIFADIQTEGKYKAQDGKLHMSQSLEEDYSDANYETYEISENVVTITSGVNIEANEILTYPFDLVKVK